MSAILFDVVILAVLILFAVLGWKKGLLLSLCGLVVMVAAFLGAGFLADTLDAPVADLVRPKVETLISESLKPYLESTPIPTAQQSWDALKDMGGLYAWAADLLENAQGSLDSTLVQTVQDVVDTAAQFVATQIAHNVIFVAAFILLFILLNLLLHALDLVAKLPGLKFCNELGGGVLGLAKGVLILFVALSVLQIFSTGLLTPQVVEESYILKFFIQYNPILSLFR